MTGYKNLGPNVSQSPQAISSGGSYSGKEKSFESLVIQDSAPVIDWEMNLRNEISKDHGLRLNNQRRFPSCFLGGDFLETPDASGSYVLLSATAGNENKFQLLGQNAVINGWPIRVEYSNTSTVNLNEITIDAPPASGNRIDLVIIEVWRALVTANPSAANKSATSLILRHGNVKAPDAVNLTDDLIDPTYTLESNARVQIQYRIRVISNVDITTYPNGLDDPSVVANSVSDFTGPGADGSATVLTYSPFDDDPGLWIAGAGNATDATTLGTVDGHMYAVPLCAISRRNSTAFDRDTNMNGATLIASGSSDRPDGLFADQIVASDILDLRKGCAQDFQEILDKMSQQVFDNTLSTSFELTNQNTEGTSPLFRDDIDITSPGSMGTTDGVRRHYSDRPITEAIVAKFELGVGNDTAEFRIDNGLLLSWDSSPLPGGPGLFNLGATIKGFNRIRVVQPSNSSDEDGMNSGSSMFVEDAHLIVNTGPQIDTLELIFNVTAPVATVIYVELLVEIPANLGTSRNIIQGIDFWVRGGLPAWVDSSVLTATSDADRTSLDANYWETDNSHRELAVHLPTITQSGVVFHTYDVDRILIWERLDGSPITINDGVNAPYNTTNYTVNTAYTVVELTGGVPITSGTNVQVDYVAFRAIPPGASAPNDSYQLFYRTAAIQSILPPSGTQTLSLIPRLISKNIFMLSSGSGSPDLPFPFASPGEQIAVGALPVVDYPEARLDGPADVNIIGFGINSGFLQLNSALPYMPNPSEVQLFRDAPDIVTDAEGRNFWPKSDDGTSSLYSPVAFAQELAHSQRHKVVTFALMELKSDFDSIGRAGTLVLVAFSNWIEYDAANSIVLTDVADTSAAAVYRIRGNLMNPRRSDS